MNQNHLPIKICFYKFECHICTCKSVASGILCVKNNKTGQAIQNALSAKVFVSEITLIYSYGNLEIVFCSSERPPGFCVPSRMNYLGNAWL